MVSIGALQGQVRNHESRLENKQAALSKLASHLYRRQQGEEKLGQDLTNLYGKLFGTLWNECVISQLESKLPLLEKAIHSLRASIPKLVVIAKKFPVYQADCKRIVAETIGAIKALKNTLKNISSGIETIRAWADLLSSAGWLPNGRTAPGLPPASVRRIAHLQKTRLSVLRACVELEICRSELRKWLLFYQRQNVPPPLDYFYGNSFVAELSEESDDNLYLMAKTIGSTHFDGMTNGDRWNLFDHNGEKWEFYGVIRNSQPLEEPPYLIGVFRNSERGGVPDITYLTPHELRSRFPYLWWEEGVDVDEPGGWSAKHA